MHDHWKPYYRYTGCVHVLSHARHKRELTQAYKLKALLDRINGFFHQTLQER